MAGQSPGAKSGRVAWQHPQRDAAGDANGHPCRDRRPIGRRHFSAAGSGGIPAPPIGAASTGGPVFGDADGRPLRTALLGGTVCGAADRRHGVRCLLLEALCTAAGNPRRRHGPPAAIAAGGTVHDACNGRHGMALAMASTAYGARRNSAADRRHGFGRRVCVKRKRAGWGSEESGTGNVGRGEWGFGGKAELEGTRTWKAGDGALKRAGKNGWLEDGNCV